MTSPVLASTSLGPALSEMEASEAELLKLPQIDCPLTHTFAPGVYIREIFMPKGAFILGHEHKTEHVNIVTQGVVRVMIDGVVEEISAPHTFISGPGIRKVLYIVKDTKWITIHPTRETNLIKLERRLIRKSNAFINNQIEIVDMRKKMELMDYRSTNCGDGVENRKM